MQKLLATRSVSLIISLLLLISCSSPPTSNHSVNRNSASSNSISQTQFHEIAELLKVFYSPVAAGHEAKLRLDTNWDDNELEAHAGKSGSDWFVYVAGGIAREKDADVDSYTFTLCHEFGHQFGGYPFVNLQGNIWNSKEGIVDYYAAFVCARNLWKSQHRENKQAALSVDPYAKAKCDKAWSSTDERNLCYRITNAGMKMLFIESKRQNLSTPQFSTPEKKKEVNLQCRLDSILQGALCSAPYDIKKIPGYLHPDGINSKGAKEEQRKATCDKKYGYTIGLKPECWWP